MSRLEAKRDSQDLGRCRDLIRSGCDNHWSGAVMTIPMVRNLELQEAVCEAFRAWLEAVGGAGGPMAGKHFLLRDAAAQGERVHHCKEQSSTFHILSIAAGCFSPLRC